MGEHKSGRSDLGALDMRARIAALETTNAHLTARVAELSFLASAAIRLGATLDRAALAREIVDAAGVAADSHTRPRVLLLRVGNALVAAADAPAGACDADAIIHAHREAIDRALRLGETASLGEHYVVPIPGDADEPGVGCIVVSEGDDDPLDAAARRRLSKLADLAGRSFANASLLAHSIAAGATDELTGVFNRRYFERRLADEVKRARRMDTRLALVLLDLDEFKAINDRHGHPDGDRTLRAVADAIARAVRDIDVVTRWGGEEFAIIVPGADGSLAVSIAERIRSGVGDVLLRASSGETFRVTVSGGVAWVTSSIHTPAQLVAAADRCLLDAKRAGRNRTMSMADDEKRQGRVAAVSELRPRDHRGAARDA